MEELGREYIGYTVYILNNAIVLGTIFYEGQ